MTVPTLTIKPLTPTRWGNFETVMGVRGGVARGCWCMHWRLSVDEWLENKGEGNERAMRALADGDRPPGAVGYLDKEPVAWCGFGDRTDFPRMQRSMSADTAMTGVASAFTAAGFTEIARPKLDRPVMRYQLP